MINIFIDNNMAKKKPKKSNFLGFRLSEEILESLDLIAKQQNKSRGMVAKEAIEQWINCMIWMIRFQIISQNVINTYYLNTLI